MLGLRPTPGKAGPEMERIWCPRLSQHCLVDVSDIFIFFCSGRGKGESEAPGGGGGLICY